MRRNNNQQVSYGYAPVKYVKQPRSTMLSQRQPIADGTDDQSDPTTGPTSQFRSKDNFDRIATIAREAYDATRVIMGELNVEDKVFEVLGNNSFDWANNLAMISLNSIPQSVNEAGRTGDSVKVKGIHISYRIFANATIPSSVMFRTRIFVTYNHAAASLVWPFPTSVSATDGVWEQQLRGHPLAPDAPRDYDNMDRAIVLHDSHHEISLEKPEARGSFYIKHHGLTQFEADSIAINTGQYSLGVVGSTVAGVTGCQIQWFSRCYFVDN